MTKDDIPTWARQKAVDLANVERPTGRAFDLEDVMQFDSLRAFARYIAAHEEEPVDPLLLEAREICAEAAETCELDGEARDYRAGDRDDWAVTQRTLTILRRGAEIGRAQTAATDAEGAKQ